jgi:NAD(P)-dependent dehydrogenase (short-subunit alcohol dehydrogenase family)
LLFIGFHSLFQNILHWFFYSSFIIILFIIQKLMKLKNKVIIVTGGTGVLGDAFNKAIAAEGATVCILGRNIAVAEERAAEIIASGGKAIGLQADVLNESDLQRVNDLILEKFGKIDGLVNAAGGNQPQAVIQPSSDLFDLDMSALENVMRLNLFGTLMPTQIFGKSMMLNESQSSIVNITSVSAHTVITKVLGYSLAKAAVDNYTKWFAVELGKRYKGKIRMNALMPGFFLTEQNRTLLTNTDGSLTDRGQTIINTTPVHRFGNPEELTAALVYLLSDDSSFVLGSTISVDGGFTPFSGV